MNNILVRPIITEKSMNEASFGKFAFEVSKDANKAEIALAVKQTFKVNPIRVQTIIVKGRSKRSLKTRKTVVGSDYKKAIVQLKSGEKIDLFDVSEQPITK